MIVVQVFIGIIILIGTSIILFTENIIHAAYALALTLIGIAGVYVFLHATLLAIVQILLYAGGVVILLSFGIMMTNRPKAGKVISKSKNKFLGALIGLSIFIGLSYLISTFQFDRPIEVSQEDQIKQIGISFITDHIVAFELVAFVLLAALVGATYLAKLSSNND